MVPPKSRRQSNLDSTAQAPRARKWIGLKCNRGNPERNVRSDVRLIRYSLCASVRYVAVGPGGMLANWSSIRVEKRRLTEKNKRPVGGESSLRFDDLCERASKVDDGGSRAFTSSPGSRSTQRVIDLEGARTVTETLQPPAIVGGKLRGCDAKQLSGESYQRE